MRWLDDGGAVYTLGSQPGTVLRNNLIHHVLNGRSLYTDQGSSFIVLENNIVYDAGEYAYLHHYGHDNTVRNNIFANQENAGIWIKNGATAVVENNLKKETVVFKGGVKRAVKYFPKNINVAATLLLASCLKDISVCIKADPKLKRNIHNVRIEAEEANLTFSVENIPSVSNPKTSALTILSTQKLLEKICFSFCVGS